MLGLHATGGSTNHTLHLVAMAKAAGITLTLQDFSDLCDSVPLLARVYVFFTQVALVTFGGAYAVLAYVNAQVVDVFGWLTAAQTVAGLGLAESTPGPLVIVLQFVGFMAGWNQPRPLDPEVSA